MAIDQSEDLGLLAPLDALMHPYRGKLPGFECLPAHGMKREEVLALFQQLSELETGRWRDGYASGSVYNGDPEHIAFMNQAYALNSQANQLHTDIWPSAAKFEGEIVSMTAHMVGAGQTTAPFGSPDGVCGSVTSGGSESILMAMKTYRDYAREKRGITQPELVVPVSAHAAFHKASQYFCIDLKITPLDDQFRADVHAIRDAITSNTIAVVGSAVNFPYGTIDPLADIAALAHERQIGMHVDGCLGGYFLPWVEKLGHDVPAFDFRLPGVTSMSVDTHKYGFAPKGTSVVLYRGHELRQFQYFTTGDWPGGLYHSPTLSGSRPGGLSAACWASLVSFGEAGYKDATRQILAAATTMKDGVRSIPELKLLGDRTYGVFAFGSDELDIYQVLDQLSARHWALTGLQHPAGIHVSTTLRMAQPGVAERFVSDLRASVKAVQENPNAEGGFAPIYGLAASIPDKTIVHEMLRKLMDVYYRL